MTNSITECDVWRQIGSPGGEMVGRVDIVGSGFEITWEDEAVDPMDGSTGEGGEGSTGDDTGETAVGRLIGTNAMLLRASYFGPKDRGFGVARTRMD